ncbi:hypothetical protein ACFLY8_02085 [Halobacteriota archaeon]
MSIFLLHNWLLLNEEIIPKLEESENLIDDFYPVLLDTYLTNVKEAWISEEGKTIKEIEDNQKEYWDLVGAVNDRERARDEFYKLQNPQTEKDAVSIIEGYHAALKDYSDPLANEYKKLLNNFLIKYNIRYIICEPCTLILTIEGLLATEYDYVKHLAQNSGSRSRKQLMGVLQNNLMKIETADEERNCISNSVKLIEHFLLEKASRMLSRSFIGRQRTLGYVLSQCPNLFPSQDAKDSLIKYYKFTNDYPNIRHVGNDGCFVRDLNKSDGLLALSLAVSYAAFSTQNYEDILYGSYIKKLKEAVYK